jgi:hypothetical protein
LGRNPDKTPLPGQDKLAPPNGFGGQYAWKARICFLAKQELLEVGPQESNGVPPHRAA